MSEFLTLLGIQNWKPVLTALALPPVPLFLSILLGARLLMTKRRNGGWALLLLSVTALWLSACLGCARLLESHWLPSPPVLSAERLRALSTPEHKTAIVVLGGGKEDWAAEYRMSNLSEASLERLRYGVWLSRATQLPLAFSGGTGWAHVEGDSEAKIAARIAREEFARPLTWTEGHSRDTRENAALTLPILEAAGIEHVVLVTHGWHMTRALHAFERASQGRVSIEAAPMGLAATVQAPNLEWVPTAEGFLRVRRVARELLGNALGF